MECQFKKVRDSKKQWGLATNSGEGGGIWCTKSFMQTWKRKAKGAIEGFHHKRRRWGVVGGGAAGGKKGVRRVLPIRSRGDQRVRLHIRLS